MDFFKKLKNRFNNLSPMKKLLLGYIVLILVGAVLLSFPFATAQGVSTSFVDSLFTSTSAACVTGMLRFDTFTYWSFYGQLILLILIQIGGIGFVTFAMSMLSLTRKKIGLSSRFTLQNSIAAPQLGGVVRMAKFIIWSTAIIECLGTILLAFYFCPRLGFWSGLWFSVFHSVSAFCNAGFDLMGVIKPFSSMTSVYDNWYVCSVLMLLVILGGLGFFVWKDVLDSRFRFKNLKLHSKIVLTVSGALLLFGALALFLTELGSEQFENMSWDEKILTSLFQSVNLRTAGFVSVPVSDVTGSGRMIMLLLMMIGGSPGSTAGGMKTTTTAILVTSVYATFRRKKSLEAFGRRFEDGAIRTASCILMTYLILSVLSAVVISSIEQLDIWDVYLETAAAISTSGITTGLTPRLGVVSELIITLLMLYGRLGSITMLLAFTPEKMTVSSKLPLEKVQIG